MKKLTEADYALLASRGISKFNTVVSTEPVEFSGFKKVKKTKKSNTTKNPLVGKILHTSWGYDMTINNFCKIIDVSPTGKTVKCQMVATEGFNGQYGKVNAGETPFGPVFRLKVDGNGYFHGSYLFSGSSKRMGYFNIHDGREVLENHMD